MTLLPQNEGKDPYVKVITKQWYGLDEQRSFATSAACRPEHANAGDWAEAWQDRRIGPVESIGVERLAEADQSGTLWDRWEAEVVNFIDYSVTANRGETIQVELSRAANVRLLDALNFARYRRGQSHRYVGGYVTQSPYLLTVPNGGQWHVVVDLGGYAGRVEASVSVVR